MFAEAANGDGQCNESSSGNRHSLQAWRCSSFFVPQKLAVLCKMAGLRQNVIATLAKPKVSAAIQKGYIRFISNFENSQMRCRVRLVLMYFPMNGQACRM